MDIQLTLHITSIFLKRPLRKGEQLTRYLLQASGASSPSTLLCLCHRRRNCPNDKAHPCVRVLVPSRHPQASVDGGPYEAWPGDFPVRLKPGQLLVSKRRPGTGGGGGAEVQDEEEEGDREREASPGDAGGDGDGGAGDGGDESQEDAPLGPTESELALWEGDGRVVQALQLRPASEADCLDARGDRLRFRPGAQYRFRFAVMLRDSDGGAETATVRDRFLWGTIE